MLCFSAVSIFCVGLSSEWALGLWKGCIVAFQDFYNFVSRFAFV